MIVNAFCLSSRGRSVICGHFMCRMRVMLCVSMCFLFNATLHICEQVIYCTKIQMEKSLFECVLRYVIRNAMSVI